jgi:hypothetical protein
MNDIHFQTIDWESVEKVEHTGVLGFAYWQTVEFCGLRIRLVEYSSGYFADHWCQKGHVVHCLDGEFITELASGEKIQMTTGQSYIVSDELSSHRSYSESGVKLLVIDGDFLK